MLKKIDKILCKINDAVECFCGKMLGDYIALTGIVVMILIVLFAVCFAHALEGLLTILLEELKEYS